MKCFLKIIIVFFISAGFIETIQSCKKKETIPSVTTVSVSGITQTSAVSGGNVTNNGGDEVTARGVCWGTTQNPTTGSNITNDGTGTGAFTSNITGLTANTAYYVRAYATNSEGTSYGGQMSFTTSQIVTATLTTAAITSITSTTAISGGNITANGGGAITSRGVCWNTSTDPTTANNITTDGTGTGSFVSNLTNLQPETTYYVKAYATNSAGTAYGNELNFITLCTAPTATTNAATNAGTSTATLNGSVNANGFSTTVTFEYGTTTSYGSTVTASQSPLRGSSNTAVSAEVTSLALNTTYHYTVIVENCGGTANGGDETFTTSNLIVVGSSYQGGIVGYILQAGDPGYIAGQTHGLIAAPSDQSTNIHWYNGSYTTTGATGTALGTGMANTNAIVTNQGAGNYAAELCKDLVLNGYSDWYLPSKDELNQLYINSVAIGGFNVGYYWSSTEIGNSTAWMQSFDGGLQYSSYKNFTNYVRAVRAF